MITIQNNGNSIIHITPEGKLKAEDFKKLEDKITTCIAKYKHVNLLINAHEFKGWDDIKALKSHYCFIKNNEKHIENAAIVVKYFWQYFLAIVARKFVSVNVKIFKGNKVAAAEKWLHTHN